MAIDDDDVVSRFSEFLRRHEERNGNRVNVGGDTQRNRQPKKIFRGHGLCVIGCFSAKREGG